MGEEEAFKAQEKVRKKRIMDQEQQKGVRPEKGGRRQITKGPALIPVYT